MIKTFLIYTILDYCIESFAKTISQNLSPYLVDELEVGNFYARIEYEIIDGDLLYSGYFYEATITANNGASIQLKYETAFHHVEHIEDDEMNDIDIEMVKGCGYTLCDYEKHCAHIECESAGEYTLDIVHITVASKFGDD